VAPRDALPHRPRPGGTLGLQLRRAGFDSLAVCRLWLRGGLSCRSPMYVVPALVVRHPRRRQAWRPDAWPAGFDSLAVCRSWLRGRLSCRPSRVRASARDGSVTSVRLGRVR